MKKLIGLILAAQGAAFLFAPQAFAKSGCCSGHDGVNCGAGAQSNGHVICNDGWTGSSCLYSEMVMCGGSSGSTSTYAPAPESIPVATLSPTPRPTLVPTPRPTKILAPKPTPRSTPAPTELPAPTQMETSTPKTSATENMSTAPASESNEQVQGVQTQEKSSPGEMLGTLGILGSMVFGGYKFFKKKMVG